MDGREAGRVEVVLVTAVLVDGDGHGCVDRWMAPPSMAIHDRLPGEPYRASSYVISRHLPPCPNFSVALGTVCDPSLV